MVVFKIIDPSSDFRPWEDPDNSPNLEFVAEKGWRDPAEHFSLPVAGNIWDNGKNKRILELDNPSKPISQNPEMTESWLPRATKMTILPVYVRLDEGLLPDLDVQFNWYGQPIIDDEAYQKALVGKPYPGGKWFYHVLVTHGDDSASFMTALKLDSDGSLIQLLRRVSGNGNFEPPKLDSKPISLSSFNQGRASYFITASSTELEAWRLQESIEKGKSSKHSLNSYLDTTFLGKLELNNIIKTVEVNFISRTLVVGLVEGGASLVLCKLNPDADVSQNKVMLGSNNKQGLEMVEQVDLTSTGVTYQDVLSFKHSTSNYLALRGLKSGSVNIISIYLVQPSGFLTLVNNIEDSSGQISEINVLYNLEDTELLAAKYSSALNEISYQIYSYDLATRSWKLNPLKTVSSQLLADNKPQMTTVRFMAKLRRFLGINLEKSPGSTSPFFANMFVIPSLPRLSPRLDTRLQKESALIVKSYELLDTTDYQTLENNLKNMMTSVVKISGSTLTGEWKIGGIKTGSLTAASLPSKSTISLDVSNAKYDGKKLLDIDLADVEEKLENTEQRLSSLRSKMTDELIKKTARGQVVNAPVVVEGKLIVNDEFQFNKAKDEAGSFVLSTLKTDETLIEVGSLTETYSKTQNNVKIGGSVVLDGMTSFDGNLAATKASSLTGKTNTEVQLVKDDKDNVLKYTGGQTFAKTQTFIKDVSLDGGISLDGSKLTNSLDLTKIAKDGIYNNRRIKLDEAEVKGTGLNAPNIKSSFLQTSINSLVKKSGDLVSIKGTLRFTGNTDKSFTTTGHQVDVVDGLVNGHDVSDLYLNSAWKTAPSSLSDSINDNSIIRFQKPVSFSNFIAQTDAEVTKINDILYTDYVKNLYPSYSRVPSVKTFTGNLNTQDILATSINSKTVDQFISKKSDQFISAEENQFKGSVTLNSISKDDFSGNF